MRRLVLGTAALGSRVSQAQAARVLRAAIDAGIRRFDTAPLYGAGYASKLLGRLDRSDITVSTKFGSPTEPRFRFGLKHLVRAHTLRDLFAWPPVHDAHVRTQTAWWTAKVQAPFIERAAQPLRAVGREFLFLHAPPMVLAPAMLQDLRVLAHARGFQLGLCSPAPGDVRDWLARPQHLACLQLHLDDWLALGQDAKPPEGCQLWLHGVYSPRAGSRLPDFDAREDWCASRACEWPSLAVVVGTTSVDGIARVAALAARLG